MGKRVFGGNIISKKEKEIREKKVFLTKNFFLKKLVF